MQTKADFYGHQVEPMMDKIYEICRENGIPMIAVFCLDQGKSDEGMLTMSIGGAHNLSEESNPPYPFLVAAKILQVPGFDQPDTEDKPEQVH